MPRLPRKYNDIGIYHIMVRGNAKQDIFIDDQDKRKFVKTILQKRKEGLFKIYAFCIMNNHAHLVVKELKESISKFMKRITTSYAFYFPTSALFPSSKTKFQ
jgi:REP element-mobilizing transposase RayT